MLILVTRNVRTLAAIQLVEAINTVSQRQLGLSCLHSIKVNNTFPNTRSRLFGDGEISPLESFARIKPDNSSLYRFGTPVTFDVLGYVKKSNFWSEIEAWVVSSVLPVISAYYIVKGEKQMTRVTNFRPLKISTPTLSFVEKTYWYNLLRIRSSPIQYHLILFVHYKQNSPHNSIIRCVIFGLLTLFKSPEAYCSIGFVQKS